MNRRTFIKTASAAGLAAAPASGLLGYSPQHDEQKTTSSHPERQSPEQILLKDYRPKSIYKIPVTEIARAKFPIIDMHSHPYAKTPQQIAEWVHTMDEVIKIAMEAPRAGTAAIDSDSKPAGGVVAN